MVVVIVGSSFARFSYVPLFIIIQTHATGVPMRGYAVLRGENSLSVGARALWKRKGCAGLRKGCANFASELQSSMPRRNRTLWRIYGLWGASKVSLLIHDLLLGAAPWPSLFPSPGKAWGGGARRPKNAKISHAQFSAS
jgi:hypothetical protein